MAAVTKRRDSHDIVAEILKAAKEGKIKSHIMLKAKVSYSQINRYLNLLVKKGLLESATVKQKRRTTTIYKTTQEGTEFLDRLEAIDKLWT